MATDNGEDWGLMTVPEVVDLSHSLDLDLIEVDGAGDPPVWRVGDYGRMKYEECVDAPRVVSEADSISRDAARRRRRKF